MGIWDVQYIWLSAMLNSFLLGTIQHSAFTLGVSVHLCGLILVRLVIWESVSLLMCRMMVTNIFFTSS